MREIKVELTPEQFVRCENLLFETDVLLGWNLYENFEDKGYWLQGNFESEADAREAWGRARDAVELDLEPEIRELPDRDWQESYKDHFQPWLIGRLHWVPQWLKETYELPPGHRAVWLDPGMAFGTGNHATTRLCVEQLLAWQDAGADLDTSSVMDAGCGSGILAISARKMGFQRVAGFDVDEEAVRIARENAVANGVEGLDFRIGGLDTGFGTTACDCVLANILAKTLLQYIDELIQATAPGGWLVLSGILATEAEDVRQRFAQQPGLDDGHMTHLGEWSAVRFIKNR